MIDLCSYSKPFDRHDWIVDREGREVRYVIDFYAGKQNNPINTNAVPMFLDVRPALDSLPALYDRIYVSFRQFFPELYKIFEKKGAR